MLHEKPIKKTDRELWRLIAEKISKGEYLFLKHAKARQKDRHITEMRKKCYEHRSF